MDMKERPAESAAFLPFLFSSSLFFLAAIGYDFVAVGYTNGLRVLSLLDLCFSAKNQISPYTYCV